MERQAAGASRGAEEGCCCLRLLCNTVDTVCCESAVGEDEGRMEDGEREGGMLKKKKGKKGKRWEFRLFSPRLLEA
ncbi:hypothetical protein EYF80_042697 [Liparis tanakae]|uniref:Uncharacterized protein n=1 Tax=Liparis tanakae TaxID=230148 RepID=A0A4Z2G1W0_9TELE|nr:hypothetical protein EYF80_042697 [Liparis tanakae]